MFKKEKRSKLRQHKDNLINYLNKAYGYGKESSIEVVEKTVTESKVTEKDAVISFLSKQLIIKTAAVLLLLIQLLMTKITVSPCVK